MQKTFSTRPFIYHISVSGKLSTRPFIYHISVSGKLSLYIHNISFIVKSQVLCLLLLCFCVHYNRLCDVCQSFCFYLFFKRKKYRILKIFITILCFIMHFICSVTFVSGILQCSRNDFCTEYKIIPVIIFLFRYSSRSRYRSESVS